MQKIAIIGAGPAGCSAAVQCLRLGVRPVLIDRTGQVGGLVANANCIENYPGVEKPLTGQVFVGRLMEHLARFDLEVGKAAVQCIDHSEDGFRLDSDAGEITCEALIVAAGTEPLRVDGPIAEIEEGRLLFYEVRDLLDSAPTARKVVVVGGGEAACDYALSLAGAGVSVQMLVRGEGLRACARLLDLVRVCNGIHITIGAHLERATEQSGRAALEIAGAPMLHADAVLAAVGRESRAPPLLERLDLDIDNSVLTRVPGLYLAGDARVGSLGQVGMAVGDGLEAAAAAVSSLRA